MAVGGLWPQRALNPLDQENSVWDNAVSSIEVNCPGCSKRLRLGEHLRGKTIRCPVCQAAFAIRSEASSGQKPSDRGQSKASRDMPRQVISNASPDRSVSAEPPSNRDSVASQSGTPERAPRVARRITQPEANSESVPKQNTGDTRPARGKDRPPADRKSTDQPSEKRRGSASGKRAAAATDPWETPDPWQDSLSSEGEAWDEYGNDAFEAGDPYSDQTSQQLPGRRNRRPARGSRGSAVPWGRIVVIGLAVVLMLSAGVGVWQFGGPLLNSLGAMLGGSVADDIAMMPGRPSGIIHVRIADIMQYENDYAFLREGAFARLSSGANREEMRGFMNKVSSITLGLPDAAADGASQMFTVMRLKVGMSESEFENLRDFGTRKDTLEGRAVFRQGSLILCRLDSYTLISGAETDVVSVLQGNRNSNLASEFKLPGKSEEISFAVKNPLYGRSNSFLPPMPSGASEATRNLSAVLQSVSSASLFTGAVHMKSTGVDASVSLHMGSSDQASTVRQQLQQLLDTGLDQIYGGSQEVPGLLASFESMQATLRSMSVSGSGDEVRLSLSLSKADVEKLSSGQGR